MQGFILGLYWLFPKIVFAIVSKGMWILIFFFALVTHLQMSLKLEKDYQSMNPNRLQNSSMYSSHISTFLSTLFATKKDGISAPLVYKSKSRFQYFSSAKLNSFVKLKTKIAPWTSLQYIYGINKWSIVHTGKYFRNRSCPETSQMQSKASDPFSKWISRKPTLAQLYR